MRRVFRESTRLSVDYILNAISWRVPGWLFAYSRSYLMFTDSPKFVYRKSDDYFIRLASPEDVKFLEQMDIPEVLCKERMNHGDQCVILGKDNEICR